MLLLPLGHPRKNEGVFPLFSAVRTMESVTKSVEKISVAERTPDAMRRAFSQLKNGRPGPVLVEIPADLEKAEIDPELGARYRPGPDAPSLGQA